MICQSVVVKVDSHVCKSWVSAPVVLLIELHVCKSGPSAPVVLLIELHVCKSGPSAPVAFHGCCPEQRQEPAQLRVLSNSPRAMSLFGLPIIVMTALYASRKQGKLQRACAYGGPEIHGCRFGSFAPVIPLFHCHGCRSLAFAPVGFHGCCPRTAARARSAQGASQFAAGYAAVRVPHHSDGRPVHIMKTS